MGWRCLSVALSNDSEVLIVFKLTELSLGCSKRIIHNIHFNYLNKAVDGEFLDFHLKRAFTKILFINSLVSWKKNEKRNEIIFWKFVWTCDTWNKCKCNIENEILFLILADIYLNTRYFFVSNTFLSNARLKIGKKSSKC